MMESKHSEITPRFKAKAVIASEQLRQNFKSRQCYEGIYKTK